MANLNFPLAVPIYFRDWFVSVSSLSLPDVVRTATLAVRALGSGGEDSSTSAASSGSLGTCLKVVTLLGNSAACWSHLATIAVSPGIWPPLLLDLDARGRGGERRARFLGVSMLFGVELPLESGVRSTVCSERVNECTKLKKVVF